MVEGTVAQEYLLATLGEKGKLPAAVQVRTCLVAAGFAVKRLRGNGTEKSVGPSFFAGRIGLFEPAV